ncbi:GNAT family N-acetyltransferase [Kribbella sp. NPDC006257]|uniref:GNAT family N-acetyltransferase n=1 Tax=Kribbella sp. NPDC006257 TaxID=3156738 RepID=UPI0033B2680A
MTATPPPGHSSPTLPAGLTVRPIEDGDIPAITALMGGYSSKLLGFSKFSLDDVANYLRDPALVPASDTWLVFDGAELVGCATSSLYGSRVDLDVTAADPAVAAWLLDTANQRADQQAAEIGRRKDRAPDSGVTVGLGILREDKLLPGLAEARGFTVGTTIQRMEIRHVTPPERPAVPAGVTLRRGAPDDATRRAAHQVMAEAFADQPTAVPRPYDDWVASRETRSTFDWSQLTLLELDGRPVAMRECNDNFVKSENCGYVGRLAVLSEARGRGLAAFLLRDAFAEDAAAGRAGTILHVDSSNPTPAVQLYLHVGMRPKVMTDIWRRTVGAV